MIMVCSYRITNQRLQVSRCGMSKIGSEYQEDGNGERHDRNRGGGGIVAVPGSERGGGVLSALCRAARGSVCGDGATRGSYRQDFPAGTCIAANEETEQSLRDSYCLVYPDGTRLTWYRFMRLDGRLLWDVLLVPVPDDQDWALFEDEAGRAVAD